MRVSQSTLSRIEAGAIRAKARHFRALERMVHLPIAKLLELALEEKLHTAAAPCARPTDPLAYLNRDELVAMKSRLHVEHTQLIEMRNKHSAALETEKDHLLLYNMAAQAVANTQQIWQETAAQCAASDCSAVTKQKVAAEAHEATEAVQLVEVFSSNISPVELACMQQKLNQLNAELKSMEQTMAHLAELLHEQVVPAVETAQMSTAMELPEQGPQTGPNTSADAEKGRQRRNQAARSAEERSDMLPVLSEPTQPAQSEQPAQRQQAASYIVLQLRPEAGSIFNEPSITSGFG